MEVILKRAVFFSLLLCLSGIIRCGSVYSEPDRAEQRIELPKEAVSKKILDNGLAVLAVEESGSGLVAIDVKIMAGPGNDADYPASGISHLVEHMVFKGTPARKPGEIEKEIKSYGGLINGSVSQDLTDYHMILPPEYLKEGLSILKDMLSNASFDRGEFDKEKEVILSEHRMNLDDPDSQLIRLLNETAYIRHLYRYPPIGYENTFKAISRDDAVNYYRKYYVPNNMVISIVGDVKAGAAIDTVSGIFSDFGRGAYYAFTSSARKEPLQMARRSAQKEFDTSLLYLAIAFHSTSLFDADLYAMDVLSMILGKGNNSRLNTSLLKAQRLVHSVNCWNYTPSDPGLFVITAVLDKEKLDQTVKAVFGVIADIRSGRIEEGEVETAKRMVLADYIFSRENIEYLAGSLSMDYIFTGSDEFSARYVAGIQAVTKEDVKNAACRYLGEDNSTIVMLVPKGYSTTPSTSSKPGTADNKIAEETLQNGLRLLIRKNDKVPVVSITAVISGGIASETSSDNGISNLTARMLLRGTSTRKERDISGAIEKMGGTINVFSGFNGFGVNAEVLNTETEAALLLIKDILTASSFPEDELEKEKSIVLAMIRQADTDIFEKGFERLRKELFPGSSYGFRILGEGPTVASLGRDDILNFYKRSASAENIVISISGDIDAGRISAKLKELFADFKRNASAQPVSRAVPKVDKPRSETLFMDKAESLVLFGFQTVSMDNSDRYALDVLGSVLSGSSGRLFGVMRDRTPLAYALGCVQKLTRDTGFAVLYVACRKDKVGEVRKILLAEIAEIRKRAPGAEEVAMAKRELITNYDTAMQTNSFFSKTTAIDELCGPGYDNIYKYKDGIGKVSADDVRSAAEKYFDPGSLAIIAVTQK